MRLSLSIGYRCSAVKLKPRINRVNVFGHQNTNVVSVKGGCKKVPSIILYAKHRVDNTVQILTRVSRGRAASVNGFNNTSTSRYPDNELNSRSRSYLLRDLFLVCHGSVSFYRADTLDLIIRYCARRKNTRYLELRLLPCE